jgi:hypothetical protein
VDHCPQLLLISASPTLIFDMDNIILTTLFSAGFCALLIALLALNRRHIDATYGKGGIIIYLALIAFFPLQGLLWPLSLCPPLNASDNPLILGEGGEPYGLNYEDYLAVALILTTIPAASFAFLLIQSRRPLPRQRGSTQALILRLASLLSRLALPLLCLSIALLLEYCRIDGFDKVWSSSSDRFDGAVYDIEGSNGSLLFTRGYPYFLYFSSIVASFGLAFGQRRFLNVCILILNAFPLLVWESRGFAIVATIGVLGGLFALRTPRSRRMAILPAIVVLFVAYQAPLVLRYLPGTGISKVGAAARLVRESSDFGFRASIVRTLQNVSQGFPVLANYYQEYKGGVNEMDQLPTAYKLLAFSPTLSFIDNWNGDYIDLHLRINPYTPIGTWAELFLMSPCLPYIVLTAFTVIVLSCLRRIAQAPLGRLLWSPVVALLFSVDIVISSQYYTRTFSRLMWVTLGLCVTVLIINEVLAMRSASRGQACRQKPRGQMKENLGAGG